MNSSAIAVLVTGLLPLLCAGIAKGGAKNYDNHDPRAWIARQPGYRARAHAAEQNSLEAFPLFAVGVLMASVAEANPQTVALWSWVFVGLRLIYIYCYVSDRATLRSLVWMLGLAVTIRLYALAF